MPSSRAVLAAAFLPLAAPAAAAQAGSHFAPLDAGGIVNQTTAYHQKQARVAVRPDGARWACAWASGVPYHDVFVRLFAASGEPLTDELQANAPVPGKRQDEPTIAMDEHGCFLVAWSDRDGLDGDGMGVFARAFDADGVPQGPDFVATQDVAESQWEPFAAARPGGGFVLGFTGQDDGDAFLRLFACDGTPLSGDVPANAFDSNAQTDPVPAVARDGTVLAAWIDFGGLGGPGTGTNIFARLFDASLTPMQPLEFLVNSGTPGGEQREPKTAADALGRFVVVWEDRQADADGIDIHARRFDAAGAPLGPEFQVNAAAAGDQVFPAVACDWVGNVTICWEDRALPGGDVRARRFDAQGAPLGAEFTVHLPSAGAEGYPDVELDWAGELCVFVHDAPDATGKTDAGVRAWRHAPLTLAGPAAPGATFGLELDLPGGAGLWRLVLLSLGAAPGIALPDGRTLGLAFDPLLAFVLSSPNGGGAFTGFSAPLDGSATGAASVALPPNPAISGLVLQCAVVTLDLAQPTLSDQLRHVTQALAITVE
jgi:hypothetical protein